MANSEETPNVADAMGVDMSDLSDTQDAGDNGKVETKSQQDVTPDKKTDLPADEPPKAQDEKNDPEYWKRQYGASSTEAKRLAEANKSLQEYQEQAEPIMDILRGNPDLLEQVNKRMAGISTTTSSTATEGTDEYAEEQKKLVQTAVQQVISPLLKEQERKEKERVDSIVNSFREKNKIDDIKWNQIKEVLPAFAHMKKPPSLDEAMEKALVLINAEEEKIKAREEGRNEALAAIHAAQDAVVPTSGGSPAPKSQKTISEQQRMIAERMGVNADEAFGE